jgi:hypothetical protein
MAVDRPGAIDPHLEEAGTAWRAAGNGFLVSRGMSAAALRGRKLWTAVAGIRARRRVSADGLRSDMPNRGRDLGVNLKTRPEMTLAGVGVLHVTPRQ